MKIKVRTVIMSHLSDVQELLDVSNSEAQSTRINFAKFLLLKYPNTDVEINADEEYSEFKRKHPNM